ncbi:MAG: hypothetical protein B7Z73_06940, partial [Planctomycetia bacterium 21-64-5]
MHGDRHLRDLRAEFRESPRGGGLCMSYRIAHLSDPHLSPAPFPGGAELRLKRFLGWVNWKRSRERLNDA